MSFLKVILKQKSFSNRCKLCYFKLILKEFALLLNHTTTNALFSLCKLMFGIGSSVYKSTDDESTGLSHKDNKEIKFAPLRPWGKFSYMRT